MIIAEIGLNHLGSRNYLLSYVEVLTNSSIDAITLQIREKEFYNNTQFDNLELSKEVYEEIILKIKTSGKKFGMAISDLNFLPFFKDKVDFYKILSKDLEDNRIINNLINRVDKPIFVSTGMSSFKTISSFLEKVSVDKRKNINLIHTRLSNKIEDTNLKAIEKMKNFFNLPIAYGNHCENLKVTYTALAFEPVAVFFYVKGNNNINHPDEKHAVSLENLKEFSRNIKEVTKAIGNGEKQTTNNIIEGQKWKNKL